MVKISNLTFQERRKEEKMKYGLSWCFKLLKKEFRLANTESTNADFYHHYFAKVAKDLLLDLTEFYKPTFSKVYRHSSKTFNMKYLNMIKLSPDFVQDCKIAFDLYYICNQIELISSKILPVFDRLKFFLIEQGAQFQTFLQLIHHFSKISNYQFTWTLEQTVLSMDIVTDFLNAA